MHIPPKRRDHFEELVYGWYEGLSEIDVRPAHQMTRFRADGRRMNAITYISKQMITQAWYRRGLIRQGGGPILGKRASCTTNLGFKARAEWQALTARRCSHGLARKLHDGGLSISPARPEIRWCCIQRCGPWPAPLAVVEERDRQLGE